jgi:hypothetical protein
VTPFAHLGHVTRVVSAMQLVCRSWASFLKSGELLELRQEAGIEEELLYVLAAADETYRWGVLSSSTGLWKRLGPVPFLKYER